ncbi:uncharacterized protein LOC118193248, partial [Stegodyphus dumicola]|uniref:uncharacterized protein LOC118193248 n=1 Tax=Stegodyphus dumicola TaxID=202533 RepID=UPI0015AEC08A
NGDEATEEKKCMLTAMWGCEAKQPLKVDMPDILCQKVLNLSEAISWSQLKVRPFQSLLLSSSLNNPHFPTIHSALNDLPKKPCVLLEHEKKEQPSSFQKRLLAVVPLSSQKPVTTKNITKFSLILCPLKKAYKSNSMNGEPVLSEEKRRSRRRQKIRSDSMTSSLPRKKHLEIENRRSSSLSAPVRKKLPELTVTQPEEDAKPPQRAASHSFLDVLFQRRRSSEGSNKRSPSHSRNSSPGPEFRKAYLLEKTSSLSSQEDLSNQSFNQDLDVSDVSEDESMDFKALGEYSISTVLQENLRTSLIDVDATEDDQKRISGGWMYKETNKDISVFKKITSFDSCVVMSYLCKGIIASPQNVVWRTLCNPLTRFMYDDTAKRITVLHEYPHGQKLIHMCNESVTLLHKEVQDFCILQTEKKEGSKFILGFHSVKTNACPPVKDVIRGTVIASGWVVEPMKDNANSCQVSYLVQMIVSSPEISAMEEISNIQSQCINNLSLIYLRNQHLFKANSYSIIRNVKLTKL